MEGKYTVAIHGDLRGRRPTKNEVRRSSPRGSFATMLLILECHAAFSRVPSTFAWVDRCTVS